nr:MAG TPA: hypothetical protein [Caudoviricetes sp.]
MKTPAFVILYLIVMMFTYIWRAAAVGSALDASTSPQDVADVGAVANWLLFFNYVLLLVIAYYRGKKIDKKYLVAFPVIGGFFDIILAFIPLIPTVMNILALVMGLSDSKQNVKVVYVEAPKDTKQEEAKA